MKLIVTTVRLVSFRSSLYVHIHIHIHIHVHVHVHVHVYVLCYCNYSAGICFGELHPRFAAVGYILRSVTSFHSLLTVNAS